VAAQRLTRSREGREDTQTANGGEKGVGALRRPVLAQFVVNAAKRPNAHRSEYEIENRHDDRDSRGAGLAREKA
jgi:hypothetical protein